MGQDLHHAWILPDGVHPSSRYGAPAPASVTYCSTRHVQGPQLMPAVLLEEIRQQQRARIGALEEALKAIRDMTHPSAVQAIDIATTALELPDPAARTLATYAATVTP